MNLSQVAAAFRPFDTLAATASSQSPGGRAVVARQMGKACLVGCRALHIDADERGDNGAAPPPEAETIARWREEAAAEA